MEQELQYWLRCLSGEYGWLIAISMWPTVLRMSLKPIQKFLTSALEGLGPDDGAWASRILGSRAWRTFVWLVDYIASVKLPVKTSLKETKE